MVTQITVNGQHRGQTFDGVGAISGGGGMARLLIDYRLPSALRYLTTSSDLAAGEHGRRGPGESRQ